ncbi:MAG: serine/threonine protein kinase [Pirellulaceae bacterium]|nr:serine/threonine protein kinase [Pirellulaceae bacterium]
MPNERHQSNKELSHAGLGSAFADTSASTPTSTLASQPSDNCPSLEALSGLLSGEPSEQTLTEHLAHCRHCLRELDRLSNQTPLNELRSRLSPNGFIATWLDRPTEDSELGTLAGFSIESQIATGGMGVVYRGRDKRLGRQVAVKVLKRIDHPQSAERFLRETRAAAKLQNDHVVPVYESGLAKDGRPFLVMPLIEGETLAQKIRRGGLEPRDAAEIIRQIAIALSAAHNLGLIHRDVKPANIMLDSTDNRAKLTDFGLVRSTDDATLTQADVLTGTPEYMSPEQATGRPEPDARSDIYSLGISLYESLVGTVPYKGRPLEILDQHRHGQPVAPAQINRSVDDSLNTICLKCLAREPERRYQTAAELADDLQRFLSGRPILAKPPTPWARLLLWTRRNPTIATSLAAVIAILLLGSIVSTSLWLQSAANAREAQGLATELSANQEQLQIALEVSESQRNRAQRRFDDLRKLANQLLFEIYPQVEYLENSLAAREAIITSALQYLDDLYLESNDDIELQAELATAYEKIGELIGVLGNSNLGDKRSGLDNYFKAQELREAVYLSDPSSPQGLEKLANNYFVVARTYWSGDQIPESTAAFEAAIRFQRERILVEPDSESAANKLAVILIESANIPSWDGQFDRANEIYDEAQQILESLIESAPENPEYKKTFARLLRAVSRIHSATGDVAAGEAALLKAIDIGQELIEIYPDDFSVARSVWISRHLLGELYIKNNLAEKAVTACTAAVEFPRSVLEREPANAFIALDLGNAYFNLARSYRQQEIFDLSREHANNALLVMQTLVEAHPEDREYQRNLAIYLLEIARADVGLADYQAALTTIDRAIEQLSPLAFSESASVYSLYDLGFAHRLAAQAHHHLNQQEQALSAIDEAIRLITLLRDTGAQQANEELFADLASEREKYSSR